MSSATDGGREAEEALRGSEERYRAFVERSSEGIWRFELVQPLPVEWSVERQLDHCYRYAYLAECNDAMARMYGYQRADEIVGARLGDFLPRSSPDSVAYLSAFIRSGYRLEDAESHEVDRHGSLRIFLNNLVGIVDDGLLLRAWGTQRDITERRRIELELRSSQERLTLASQAAGLGTFEWNIQTNEVVWTPEEEALYGLPPGGFGGSYENWRRAVHPDDLERAEGDVLRAAAEGTDLDTEFRIVRPDGSIRVIAARGRVFRDAAGRPERMIGVNEDVTARKQSEEELRRFKTISDFALDSHFMIDRAARIRYANRAACAGLGYSEAELLNLSIPQIDPRFSDDAFRARIELGAGARVPRFESVHRRKDGSTFPVEVSATILEFGGEPYMCSIVRDITRREALLAAERRARAEAEAAVQARDEFLSVASHELRTPLTTLTAHVQLLLRRAAMEGHLDPERMLRSLRNVEHEADRLARLIAQLLDVSRLDAGRLQLEPQETDLRRLVDDIVAGAQARTDRHQIGVCGPPALRARVDPLRIEQVVVNLLDNAIKYSQDGGPIEVSLDTGWRGAGAEAETAPEGARPTPDARRSTPTIEISVRDRGPGIPVERRSGLFDPYYQAHAEGHRSGMGLGLYISRQIVELHGGTIRAEFPEDGGTRFVFNLPAAGPATQPV